MRPSLNVVVVGYGFAGRVIHAPLIAAVEGLRLHGVVSGQGKLARSRWPKARVYPELSAALADPAVDLVVIATPSAVHARQAHAALDAGKHVVVDKPFTVTVAEAEGVVAHAERAGRLVSVFHNRRWDSDFLTVRKLIAEGALGEVTHFESRFDRYRPVVRDRWRERAGPGAGLWYDLGPHLVDQALQLFGEPLGITADIATQRAGAEVDDYFHVVLQYERLRVVLHASMLAVANDLRFAVHGTRGSYVKCGTDPQEAALRAGEAVGGDDWGVDASPGVLTVVAEGRTVVREVESERGDWRRYYEGVRDAVCSDGSMQGRWPKRCVRRYFCFYELFDFGLGAPASRYLPSQTFNSSEFPQKLRYRAYERPPGCSNVPLLYYARRKVHTQTFVVHFSQHLRGNVGIEGDMVFDPDALRLM